MNHMKVCLLNHPSPLSAYVFINNFFHDPLMSRAFFLRQASSTTFHVKIPFFLSQFEIPEGCHEVFGS